MQLPNLFEKFDALHKVYGDNNLTSIYGAGEIESPNICLIFMNPTAKNIASTLNWQGLKAPWLGTKNVWRLLYKLGLFNNYELIQGIETRRPEEWTEDFANEVYKQVSSESLYITNIAKCTQSDAKHLPDSIYKEYLPLMLEELSFIKPKVILALGNQVSSVLLQKPISVSKYANEEYEYLKLDDSTQLKVYPSYYPVGQGMRNMSKAIQRINKVLNIIKASSNFGQ